MSTIYKVLGQESPASTTLSNLYTVPSGTQTVVSSIVIANRSAVASSYRLAVAPPSVTVSLQHYIAYDVQIGPNDSATLVPGVTVDSGSRVLAYSSSENLSFSLFGMEIV
jgi:hypothetical protein